MLTETQNISASAVEEIEKKPGERKSKLVIVREQVLANPAVFYAGEVTKYAGVGGWTQTIGMIVAPVKPIFDYQQLNEFMHGIVDVKPTQHDDARPYMEDGINLGRLYFDEPIGKMRTQTTTFVTPIEAEALQKAGITIGETNDLREQDIMRRTWLRVYPDAVSARAIFEYEQGVMNEVVEPNSRLDYSEHWIEGEQLKRMRNNHGYNPFVRIIGILTGK